MTRTWQNLTSRYGLVGIWLVMIVVYGAVTPSTFLHGSTLQTVLGSQTALVFLSFAALGPLTVGEWDLSFASVMGLAATIVAVLSTLNHVNVWLSCLAALAASIGCGALNALFVVALKVPSLIVTLGTGSVLLGLAEFMSSSNTIALQSPQLAKLFLTDVLGLPLAFYYCVLLCAVYAYILVWTPLGRHIAFVGANRAAARLSGVNVDRIRAASYITGALVSGMAGIVLIATVGGFDPTGSGDYLLPAFAAVFVGTAVVSPGQFNPVGTFLGVYFLETGVIGLQLLGYSGWVQDAFYGAGLVLAVTAATLLRGQSG